MSALTDRIEAVLRAHSATGSWSVKTGVECGCGCRSVNHHAHVAERVEAELRSAGYGIINIPVIPFKGPNDTDADYYRSAAEKLERGFPLGGGNLTMAVAGLLRSVSAWSEVES